MGLEAALATVARTACGDDRCAPAEKPMGISGTSGLWGTTLPSSPSATAVASPADGGVSPRLISWCKREAKVEVSMADRGTELRGALPATAAVLVEAVSAEEPAEADWAAPPWTPA